MIKKALAVAIIMAVAIPLQACSKATENQTGTTQKTVQETKIVTTESLESGLFTDRLQKVRKDQHLIAAENIIGTEALKLRQICNKEEALISNTAKNKDGNLELSNRVQSKIIQLMKDNAKAYPEAAASTYLSNKYEKSSQFFYAVNFLNDKTVEYHVVLLENPVSKYNLKLVHGLDPVAQGFMLHLLKEQDINKFVYKSVEVTMGDDCKFTASKESTSTLSDIVSSRMSRNSNKQTEVAKSTENQQSNEITKDKAIELAKEYTRNKTNYKVEEMGFALFNNEDRNNPNSLTSQPVENPQNILYYVQLMDLKRNKYCATICVYKDGTCKLSR